MEAKSGYGLSTESELKLLNVMERLNAIEHTPSIDATWMGAHDIPSETTHEQYVESLLSEQLPAVVEQGIARSADVFCEPGWFTVEESEDLLKASKSAGLRLRMHVDEFVDGGGGELACSLGVDTADHAYHTPNDVRLSMKQSGVNTGFFCGRRMPWAIRGRTWWVVKTKCRLRWQQISIKLSNTQSPVHVFVDGPTLQRIRSAPLRPYQHLLPERHPTQSGLMHGVIAEVLLPTSTS